MSVIIKKVGNMASFESPSFNIEVSGAELVIEFNTDIPLDFDIVDDAFKIANRLKLLSEQ